MKERIAVYPGSFDPITNGHLDVIGRALKIFDKLVIAVLENGNKECLFSSKERADMIKGATKGMRVEVESFSGLLVDYLRKKKTSLVVRGLRAVSDFDHEFQMAIANKKLEPETETIFILTDKEYFYLSSTTVKELARNKADVKDFVPKNVQAALEKKFSRL